jgi:hypothetical protein
MMFENWALGEIFGPKRQEITREWINCVLRISVTHGKGKVNPITCHEGTDGE